MNTEATALSVRRDRDYEVFHAFVRNSWQWTLNRLVPDMHSAWQESCQRLGEPKGFQETATRVDDLLEFQLIAWVARHLQRIRYYNPYYGYFPTVSEQRDELLAKLEESTHDAGDRLRLNPEVRIPDYLRWADFHQHRGGTWSDDLDGLIYELARQSAFLTETGDRNIYRWSYSMLPDRNWGKVLDWGTGHGAGIMEFKRMFPDAECYGVDLSAPCLKIAHYRAVEQGLDIRFSQQDLELLDFPGDTFDLAVHIFMWHEIPPRNLVKVLREVHRVLKPGGRLCGPESCVSEDSPYLQVIQNTLPWLIDEVYFNAWHDFDLEYWAREVGFSEVIVEPWGEAYDALENPREQQINQWKYFQLVK